MSKDLTPRAPSAASADGVPPLLGSHAASAEISSSDEHSNHQQRHVSVISSDYEDSPPDPVLPKPPRHDLTYIPPFRAPLILSAVDPSTLQPEQVYSVAPVDVLSYIPSTVVSPRPQQSSQWWPSPREGGGSPSDALFSGHEGTDEVEMKDLRKVEDVNRQTSRIPAGRVHTAQNCALCPLPRLYHWTEEHSREVLPKNSTRPRPSQSRERGRCVAFASKISPHPDPSPLADPAFSDLLLFIVGESARRVAGQPQEFVGLKLPSRCTKTSDVTRGPEMRNPHRNHTAGDCSSPSLSNRSPSLAPRAVTSESSPLDARDRRLASLQPAIHQPLSRSLSLCSPRGLQALAGHRGPGRLSQGDLSRRASLNGAGASVHLGRTARAVTRPQQEEATVLKELLGPAAMSSCATQNRLPSPPIYSFPNEIPTVHQRSKRSSSDENRPLAIPDLHQVVSEHHLSPLRQPSQSHQPSPGDKAGRQPSQIARKRYGPVEIPTLHTFSSRNGGATDIASRNGLASPLPSARSLPYSARSLSVASGESSRDAPIASVTASAAAAPRPLPLYSAVNDYARMLRSRLQGNGDHTHLNMSLHATQIPPLAVTSPSTAMRTPHGFSRAHKSTELSAHINGSPTVCHNQQTRTNVFDMSHTNRTLLAQHVHNSPHSCYTVCEQDLVRLDHKLSTSKGAACTAQTASPTPCRITGMDSFSVALTVAPRSIPLEGGILGPTKPTPLTVVVKAYQPLGFATLRGLAGTVDLFLKEFLTSPRTSSTIAVGCHGRSGSVFCLSNNGRFLIKSVSQSERRVCNKTLPMLVEHLRNSSMSLIVPCCLLLKISVRGVPAALSHWGSSPTPLYLIVMDNVLFCPSSLRLDLQFDLKGRAPKRGLCPPRTGKVLQDFHLSADDQFILSADDHNALLATFQSDLHFLSSNNLMDYSLLLGVLRRDTAKIASAIPMFRVFRGYTKCVVNGRVERQSALFSMGFIDNLTLFGVRKTFSYIFKRVRWRKVTLSTIPSEAYASRLHCFLTQHFLSESSEEK